MAPQGERMEMTKERFDIPEDARESFRRLQEEMGRSALFYRERLAYEHEQAGRLVELDRLLTDLFQEHGYSIRDALDGVRMLIEQNKAHRYWAWQATDILQERQE